MPYLEFPSSLGGQWQGNDRPRLIGVSRTPGRTLSGVMPAGRTDGGGLWSHGFQVILKTPDNVRAWDSLAEYLAEGATPIVLPVWNRKFAPFPLDDAGQPIESYGSIPHDDDTLFSDGSGYSQNVIVASVGVAAALRATTIFLDMTFSGELRGSELFTILHPTIGPRMYRVISVSAIDGTRNTVRIDPPLREDVAAGTEVDFDRPRFVAQLNGTMPLALELEMIGRPSVSFIESFLPEPD
jgi:hypothetical protein